MQNFRGTSTVENYEKCESLAQRIIPIYGMLTCLLLKWNLTFKS